MNFINGRIADDAEAMEALLTLGESILATKARGSLDIDAVICALDEVSRAISEGEHLPLLTSLGMSEQRAREALGEVKLMLSADYIKERLRRELPAPTGEFIPLGRKSAVKQTLAPLGTLFHIAAGNVDALPAMSVIEGLITGNINILKLPSGDDGLSIKILGMLTQAEPMLSSYIYAFDVPSGDIASMKVMAASADAIVVWGGDEAISGVRRLAPPGVKLIEWGHRLSFAYISGDVPESKLLGLARNICETNQLYCNSCQGIFLDTDSFEEVVSFAGRFASILDEAAATAGDSLLIRARNTLEIYTDELESEPGKKRVFRGAHSSVIAKNDAELAPSHMYRTPWVKPLPMRGLLRALSPHRGRLQTAALICENNMAELERLLIAAGVTRVTSGQNMSKLYCAAPHDGELSLMRYVKVTSVEY